MVKQAIAAITPSDVAYDEGTWNANTDPATKNAIRDKFESLSFTHCHTLTWSGNGNNDRSITGFGFDPIAVICFESGASYYDRHKTDDMAQWYGSWVSSVGSGYQDLVCDLIADGIMVNHNHANDQWNKVGSTYYAIALG